MLQFVDMLIDYWKTDSLKLLYTGEFHISKLMQLDRLRYGLNFCCHVPSIGPDDSTRKG